RSSDLDNPHALDEVRETGKVLKKYLPQKVGDHVLSSDGTFTIGGNWRIAYDIESEERTNIHTGEKYTDISSQYVVLDREILLSGDESAIKKHINERIKKAGIKSEVSSVKPAAKTIQSKSEIISKAKMKYQNALQNIAYWRL